MMTRNSDDRRGRNGGLARAASMTAEQRSAQGSKAAKTRWGKAEWTRREDMEDKLIVTVELKSGKFHSRIEVPLFASDDTKQAFIESWLHLIEMGIKAGRSSREYQVEKTFTKAEQLRTAIEQSLRGQQSNRVDNAADFTEKVMENLKRGPDQDSG